MAKRWMGIAGGVLAVGALCFGLTASEAALPDGARAPDFTTMASLGGKEFKFSLSDALKKGPVVLYFYPAAFTKGCTIEAHAFADSVDDFSKLGATVIGVSADPIAKLDQFSVSECRSKFPVASADVALITKYDAKLPVAPIANRTSYVIAPDGRVIFSYTAMDPAGHVEKTMAAVKAWRAAHPQIG